MIADTNYLKQPIGRCLLVILSVLIGVLLCEGLARIVLNPADYLSPLMIKDNILGITIGHGSSGYDEWGFRNRSAPREADIVAIGDSHTYGNTARMIDSWPSVVARETGLEVYNLALGGYGPNQYSFLLKEKGLRLHPKVVLCGVYMGDDFENAFSITYGLDHWSFLRRGRFENVDPNIWDPGPSVWGASVRNWLSSHSMVYRLIFHGPGIAMLKEFIRFREVSKSSDPYTTALIIEERNIREAFRPLGVAESLNQQSGPIREGMRITFYLLEEMNRACIEVGCKFIVVIIPTKETVFSEYLENNSTLHLHEVLSRVIVNERLAKKTLVEFLDDAGIAHVDTLPALKQSIGDQLYAQTTRDMHPGKNGYKVIGQAVAQYVKTKTTAVQNR